MKILPEYNWLPWQFSITPKGYWSDISNQKTYMNWLFNKLNYKTIEDWYNVTGQDIIGNHGGGLLEKYKGSPIKLLSSVFPEYNWLPWKFHSIPKGFWEKDGNQMVYMKWLEDKLNVKSEEDWYNVSVDVINKFLCFFVLKLTNELASFAI